MTIDCDCSVDNYDAPTFGSGLILRTARKSHQCGECNREIIPGEKYEYSSQVYDNEWSTNKTCLGCRRIRDRFCPNGWIWGGVAEAVEECIGFNYVTDDQREEE